MLQTRSKVWFFQVARLVFPVGVLLGLTPPILAQVPKIKRPPTPPQSIRLSPQKESLPPCPKEQPPDQHNAKGQGASSKSGTSGKPEDGPDGPCIPRGHDKDPSAQGAGGSSSGDASQKQKNDTEKSDSKDSHDNSSALTGGVGGADWTPQPFDFNLEPLVDQQVGRRIVSSPDGDRKVNKAAGEIGGDVTLEHIPVLKGFLTWDMSLNVGGARGRDVQYSTALSKLQETVETKKARFVESTKLYKRNYIEITQDLYHESFRPRLILGYGTVEWDHLPKSQATKSQLVGFGLGWKLPQLLESWGQWRRYLAYVDSDKDPLLAEIDSSLALKSEIKGSKMGYSLEAGLGISRLVVYQDERKGLFEDGTGDGRGRKVLGEGIARSLRFLGRMFLTEGIIGEFVVRYSFSASEGLEEAYNGLKLPQQRLGRLPLLASAPEDDMLARAFVGAVDWIEDLTLGWAYYNQIKDFSKGVGARSREFFSGPVIEYVYHF